MRANFGSSRFAAVLAALAALGCGDDDGMTMPGPTGIDVEYDEVAACAAAPACEGYEVESACSCVRTPRPEDVFATNRTGCDELQTSGTSGPRSFEEDFCDEAGSGGGPDLGCFMPGMYRTAGTSQMVTMYGVVDVFGNGADADMIVVEVYREGAGGELGELVGMSTASIADACAEMEDEIDNDMVIGTRMLGFYSIANVPTETPLIVKTSGNASFWRPLYTYNVYIQNDEVTTDAPPAGSCASIPAGARHEYEAKILSRSDYTSIPLTAGLVEGIADGNGAVAGEIHDCGDVRVEYAQVGTWPRAVTTTYFNDNPDNPLPTMQNDGTSVLGLYAALDIPPGPVDVAAAGRIGNGADARYVSLGWYRARVFAGSVTVVTLRGPRPHQIASGM